MWTYQFHQNHHVLYKFSIHKPQQTTTHVRLHSVSFTSVDTSVYHRCCCRHRGHSLRDMADQDILPHSGGAQVEDPARLREAPGGPGHFPPEPDAQADVGLVAHHTDETMWRIDFPPNLL